MNSVTVYGPVPPFTTADGRITYGQSGAQTASPAFVSLAGAGAAITLPAAPTGGTINLACTFDGSANLAASLSVSGPPGQPPLFFAAEGGSVQTSLPANYSGWSVELMIASADGTPALVRNVNLSANAGAS